MTTKEIYALPVDKNGCRQLPNGNYITLGDFVKLRNDITLGDDVTLGDNVTLDDNVTLGNYITLGDGVIDVIDLGYCEGYRKAVACVNGVAYIAAGCRWFTLKEAINHWKDRKEDRPITRIMIVSAIKIAKLKGWKMS